MWSINLIVILSKWVIYSLPFGISNPRSRVYASDLVLIKLH